MIVNGREVRGWSEYKKCSRCQENLPIDRFSLRRSSVGEHLIVSGRCKACRVKRRHELRAQKIKNGVWDTAELKTCRECRVEKKYDLFAASVHHANGRNPVCNECRKDERREKIYGVSRDQFNQMLDEQDGVCYLCKNPETRMSTFRDSLLLLSVDHCHATGEVRRLLCSACNLGLGSFKDNPGVLRAAADYIEHFKKESPT